jgi:ABC-2 type transport system permease protein
VLRFWKVSFQTVGAPVLTALLYLMIFSHVLEAHVQVHGVPYAAFLIPGLVMMSALQNAFANSSSSLIQSKVTGSVVFVLLPPISYVEFFLAYVVAAMLRGLMVGGGVLLVTIWFAVPDFAGTALDSVFIVLGGGIMGALGMIAGIWADKFDQLAGFQNFLIMPLTMLSGVFYSIHSLPGILAAGIAFQSRVLYDRRLSLRLLRRLGRGAGDQPGGRRHEFPAGIGGNAAAAAERLQTEVLNHDAP